jgi:hypothetical protein
MGIWLLQVISYLGVGIKLGEYHWNKLYALQSVTGKLEVTCAVWSICVMEIAEHEKIP